jgi:nucleoside-triphosphatase
VGVRAIDEAVKRSRLIVMDEIGRMELCSQAFQEAVGRALDSPRPVLGTIQDRSNAFLDSVRARPDVKILRVGTGNRECLVPVLRDLILELLGE